MIEDCLIIHTGYPERADFGKAKSSCLGWVCGAELCRATTACWFYFIGIMEILSNEIKIVVAQLCEYTKTNHIL